MAIKKKLGAKRNRSKTNKYKSKLGARAAKRRFRPNKKKKVRRLKRRG